MNNLDRKKATLIVLVATILLISIGFAVFTSVLNISTTATYTPNSDNFRIKFSKESNSIKDGTNNPIVPISGNGENAIITNGTVPTVTGLKANFVNPGESVVYEFYTVNQTGYDAYLTNIIYNNIEGKSVIKECIPGEGATDKLVQQACAGINLKVQVEGMQQVASTTTVKNHKLGKNSSEKITITIEYNGSPVDGPLTITFGDISFTYSTADDGSENIPGGTIAKACTLTDSNNNNEADVGEVVTCGTESFYVIPNDPVAHPESANTGMISMLAAQNIEISTEKPKQSDSAGTTQFADNNYWSDREFRSFVYDNNTIISDYVNAYKETLKNIGLSADITTTLVSLNQLTSSEVGCTVHESQGWGDCSAAPSWVSNVSYCTGSTHNPDSGSTDNLFSFSNSALEAYFFSFTSSYGVRPVVILSETDIEFVGLEAGLYDENDNLVASWDELVNTYGLNIEKDYASYYEPGTMYYVLQNNQNLILGKKMVIPEGITKIGNQAFFESSNLTSVTIPSSVTSIGDYAFSDCYSLRNVTIPSSVTRIGNQAFYLCYNIISIKIPSSVINIGTDAFYDCTSLTTIYYKGTATGAPWGATNATVINDY